MSKRLGGVVLVLVYAFGAQVTCLRLTKSLR